MTELIDNLQKNRDLPDTDLKLLIESNAYDSELHEKADSVRREHYGTDIYVRCLIEFTNNCQNNCYYCGIRAHNKKLERYRLSREQILNCCEQGYALGMRTFVLQGGEDPDITNGMICETVSEIKKRFSDCAVTLSIGERSYESYKAYFDAGADRYLLRQETANEAHYKLLHPAVMDLQNRKNCLFNLKKIGYQTGAGFMAGSPFQTTEHIIEDLRFLQDLKPDMIGIGPFISHNATPFGGHKNGSLYLTLRLLAILRLMFPRALIPATTALGTIEAHGRELGLKCGANVVMPNLTPEHYRRQYDLYNGKFHAGDDAAKSMAHLKEIAEGAGYRIVTDIGHVK